MVELGWKADHLTESAATHADIVCGEETMSEGSTKKEGTRAEGRRTLQVHFPEAGTAPVTKKLQDSFVGHPTAATCMGCGVDDFFFRCGTEEVEGLRGKGTSKTHATGNCELGEVRTTAASCQREDAAICDSLFGLCTHTRV